MSTTVPGSQVQFLLEVIFLLNLFCSNTTLASMPEWSILRKTSLSSMFEGKSSQLRKHGFGSLHSLTETWYHSEHLTWTLTLLYKRSWLNLIHCFDGFPNETTKLSLSLYERFVLYQFYLSWYLLFNKPSEISTKTRFRG